MANIVKDTVEWINKVSWRLSCAVLTLCHDVLHRVALS